GSISPAGVTMVAPGGSRAYAITAAPGYAIGDVRVDGVPQGPLASYAFTNVAAPHTINARFIRAAARLQVSTAPGGLVAAGSVQNFGPVLVGGDRSVAFTIQNIGGADLTGLGITIDGPDAAVFSLTASPTAPVSGPGGVTGFTVQFAPVISG